MKKKGRKGQTMTIRYVSASLLAHPMLCDASLFREGQIIILDIFRKGEIILEEKLTSIHTQKDQK